MWFFHVHQLLPSTQDSFPLISATSPPCDLRTLKGMLWLPILLLWAAMPVPLDATWAVPVGCVPDWDSMTTAMRFPEALPQPDPMFIVLFGAQGMGKGVVLRRWATANLTVNYCHINVDAIVRALPLYNVSVDELLSDVSPEYPKPAQSDTLYWTTLLSEAADKLDSLYYGLRTSIANRLSDLFLNQVTPHLQRYLFEAEGQAEVEAAASMSIVVNEAL